MSAIVFCLTFQQVMDITEYLHPSHSCAVRTPTPRRGPNPRILHPRQMPLIGDNNDT